jgi:ADP-ribose pyrophosphatase YjhB (NUDIX family)
VLVSKRLAGKYAGLYQFPGGKLETGETTLDAAKRELFEEVRVSPHEIFFTDQQKFGEEINEHGHYIIFFSFACYTGKDDILPSTEPDKHSDWYFKSWNDLGSDLSPGIKCFLGDHTDYLTIRRGWRYFYCETCGNGWKTATRDRFSPSVETCSQCGLDIPPIDQRVDRSLPVDDMGNLIL